MTTSTRSTRATRASKVKPTIIDDVEINREATSQEELEAKIKTTKRELVGSIAGLFTMLAGIYYGNIIAGVLSLAVLVLTGSGFLTFCVYFIAAMVAIVAAIKASTRLQRCIVDGSLDQKVIDAQQFVVAKASGWYNNAAALFGAKGATT